MSRTPPSINEASVAVSAGGDMLARLIGTIVAAGGSALFWVAFLHYGGPLVGLVLPGAALAVIGFAIAEFLALVIGMVHDET